METTRAQRASVPPDALARFLSERCTVDAYGLVPVRRLYEEWRTWGRANQVWVMGINTFTSDLVQVLPEVEIWRPRDPETKAKLPRHYRGVALKMSDTDRADAELDQWDDCRDCGNYQARRREDGSKGICDGCARAYGGSVGPDDDLPDDPMAEKWDAMSTADRERAMSELNDLAAGEQKETSR